MNSLDIMRHALAMLMRNREAALRVSAPLLIGLIADRLLRASSLSRSLLGPDGEPPGGQAVFLAVVLAVVGLLVVSWTAVAWHRYILREEAPGLLPPLRLGLVWGYLGRSILIGLIVALIGAPAIFALALVAVAVRSVAAATVASLILVVVLGWVGTRFGLVLPAGAVERPLRFGEAWSVTAPASGAILGVAALLTMINTALDLALDAGPDLVAAVLGILAWWLTTMLGLSVLTTLYGHLVERRPLT